MNEWLTLAGQASVRKRAFKYALVVGGILIAINHGAALWRGEWAVGRLVQMLLTVCVPYAVSTLSSVSAMREARGSVSREHTSAFSQGGCLPQGGNKEGAP